MFSQWSIGHRGIAIVASVLLIIGLAATVMRIDKHYHISGPTNGNNDGYCDFHNGVYYPSLALLRGHSPYGSRYAAEYPVARQIPFFSPAIIAVHIPLALLPLRVAEVIYFVIMVALIFGISALSVVAAGIAKRRDWVLCIAAAIVYSRAGHVTLFNGYFTFEIVLATLVAFHFAKSRPWLAAFALLIVSAKPTFILPLGFLMLVRGDTKALVLGATFSIVAALVPFLYLAHHEGSGNIPQGVSQIRQQIADAQVVHHNEPNELPELSWTRVDIFAIYAKWTKQDPGDLVHLAVMIVILMLPMLALYSLNRLGRDDGIAGLAGGIAMSAMIVSLYRQSYDVLLLVPPMVGLAAAALPYWRRVGPLSRTVLLLLMLFPAYNYLSTQMVLGSLNLSSTIIKIVTSVNAIVMVIVLIWFCILSRQDRHDPNILINPK